jgi:hypothetical protein
MQHLPIDQEHQLSYLNNKDRLKIYSRLLQGCDHLYSKGKLQVDKAKLVLDDFIKLADDDPYFLAHFNSYAIQKLQSKDLKLFSTFANSLSDADGTMFQIGIENGKPVYGKIKKPNLRVIAQAAIQTEAFDAKMIERLIEIANIKQVLGKRFKEGTHFARSLKTAIEKYVKFREHNLKAIEGIKKSGMSKRFQNIYRALHISPSMEVAAILGWNQKKGGKVKKVKFFDFKDMTDIEIAGKIRKDKLPVLSVVGAIPKMSPVIAASILEQCTGDQAIIMREIFDSQGLLKNKEVVSLFTEKVKTAKTALDRVDRINTEIDEDIQKVLKSARAEVRKEQVGDIGKIFIHIDKSTSMKDAIDKAKEHCSIFAECIADPENNFRWGMFGDGGEKLSPPQSYEKDGFQAALYGRRATDSSTDCFGCFEIARKENCDIDVYFTDGCHNVGNINIRLRQYKAKGYKFPKLVVIIKCGIYNRFFATYLEQNNIPIVEIDPKAIKESALVSQTIKEALKGPMVVIDEIMNTPLLKLPKWWASV